MLFELALKMFIILGTGSFMAQCVILTAERAELLYFNQTILNDPSFHYGKYNRTTYALNASFTIMKDIKDRQLLATITGDQFYHNEYRFTGQKITVNVCEAYESNFFNMIEQLNKSGLAIDLCDIKRGRYESKNFVMESKYYPEFIPVSKWRINVEANHKDLGKVFNMRWYLDIKAESKLNNAH